MVLNEFSVKNKIALSIIIVFLGLVYYISFKYIYVSTQKELINQQLETSKTQANIVASLLSERLSKNYSKEQVKNELQKSIENTSVENSFICMFDDTGKEICHPNKAKIGKVLGTNNSIIQQINNDEVEQNFKDAVISRKATGGLRKLKKNTEIVYLSPVENSNWIVASHANIKRITDIFYKLKQQLILLFFIVWISSTLLIYYFLNQINKSSLKTIQKTNVETSTKYFSEIERLNQRLSTKTNDKESKRLLANKGYQLAPVFYDNIAFIYTENKITYLIEYNNEKSSVNLSLEELYNVLDNDKFYRASRQVIIAAKAIDKIEKYGTTQLSVLTNPVAPMDIIISKAKLSDFKKWIATS